MKHKTTANTFDIPGFLIAASRMSPNFLLLVRINPFASTTRVLGELSALPADAQDILLDADTVVISLPGMDEVTQLRDRFRKDVPPGSCLEVEVSVFHKGVHLEHYTSSRQGLVEDHQPVVMTTTLA